MLFFSRRENPKKTQGVVLEHGSQVVTGGNLP